MNGMDSTKIREYSYVTATSINKGFATAVYMGIRLNFLRCNTGVHNEATRLP